MGPERRGKMKGTVEGRERGAEVEGRRDGKEGRETKEERE